MPAHKRWAVVTDENNDNNSGRRMRSRSTSPSSELPTDEKQQQQQTENDEEEEKEQAVQRLETNPETELVAAERDESDEDESPSSAAGDNNGFVLVKLAEIRKEVQCPICLGIIRKTRTVMECLHRFCRECIDKSMRLGNNECPACRTHCASRRSLRDDPNYDNLIAALYPDIDKYEEAELAFREEEKNRNRKIQESIAETIRRQSEALGKRRSTRAAGRSQYRNNHGQTSYLRGRGRRSSRNTSFAGSDDEYEDDANGSLAPREYSSADDNSPDARPKRNKRWTASRSSPARTTGNIDAGGEEAHDAEGNKDSIRASPLKAGNPERLSWGKGGTRSQTRHGNASGSNGRFVKGGRIAKLVEYLRNLGEKDEEFDIHYTVLPLDAKSIPCLERPHLCSPPNLLMRQLCSFIAGETQCCPPNEVEIYVNRAEDKAADSKPADEGEENYSAPYKKLQIVGEEETLAGLYASNKADLVQESIIIDEIHQVIPAPVRK